MASTALTSTGVRFPNNSDQFSALPNNTIAFWSGSIASIPTGWKLCDGTNGTPDLRDRFVVGAGSTYSIGNSGGAASVTLSAPEIAAHSHPSPVSMNPAGGHAHPASNTNSVANHVHSFAFAQMSGTNMSPFPGRLGPLTLSPAGGSHSHPASTNEAGGHNHTVSVTINATGSGDSHENRPPFYALAFIMEVS
jgi:microcystin-dependent protein